MVGLNIPISVEILPESLRNITRTLNSAVSNIDPNLNISPANIKNTIETGFDAALKNVGLDVKGLTPTSITSIKKELTDLLDVKLNKLTVTAAAKKEVAREIQESAKNIDILLNLNDFKESFKQGLTDAQTIKGILVSASEQQKNAQSEFLRLLEATQKQRGVVADAPGQLDPSFDPTKQVSELKNLKGLETALADAKNEVIRTNGNFNFFNKQLKDLELTLAKEQDELERALGTDLETERERLKDSISQSFTLTERGNRARRDAIRNLVDSNVELRDLKGIAKQEANEKLKGIEESATLADAQKQLKEALKTGNFVRAYQEAEDLRKSEEKLADTLFKAQKQSDENRRKQALRNRKQAAKLVSNIGRNARKVEDARLKAIKDNVNAFKTQTTEVLKGAGEQAKLFAKLRKTLSDPAVAGGAGLGGVTSGGVEAGSIRGFGSLQQFASGLDPRQVTAFQGALRRVGIEVEKTGKGLDRTTGAGQRFGTQSRQNIQSSKGFANGLKEMGERAFVAFKRLLLYTVISQVIFGVTRKIKEAASALVDFETQARRLLFFESVTNKSAKAVDGLQKSTATIQSTFDKTIGLANSLGISIDDATKALVTAARVGQSAGTAFTRTVAGLIRIEGGALGAEAAVTNLNAISRQFFTNIEKFAPSANESADAIARIGAESTLAGRSIEGLGAVLATTAAKSSLNVQQLSDVVARVGSAFAQLQGTDPVTLIALVGEAASVSGAQVGRLATGLKQSASLIIQNADKIERLTGKPIFEDGRIRGLPAILEVLQKANEAQGTSRQRAILSNLFDRRSLDVGAALASAVGKITERVGSLTTAEGRAQFVREQTISFLRVQEDLTKGLDAAFNRLDNTIQGFAANENLIRLLSTTVDIARLLFEEFAKGTAVFNAIGGAFKDGETTLSLLADAAEFVRLNFSQFLEVFAEINPFLAFGKSIRPVVNSLVEMVRAFREGKDASGAFSDAFSEVVAAIGRTIKVFFTGFISVVVPLAINVGVLIAKGLLIGFKESLGEGSTLAKLIGATLEFTLGGVGDSGEEVGEKFAKGVRDKIAGIFDFEGGDFEGITFEGRRSGLQKEQDALNKSIADRADRAAQAELDADEARRRARQARAAQNIDIENDVARVLKEQEKIVRQMLAARGDTVKTLELEAKFQENVANILSNAQADSEFYIRIAQRRLALEKSSAIELENQRRALEDSKETVDAISKAAGGVVGRDLKLKFDRRALETELAFLQKRLEEAVDIEAARGVEAEDDPKKRIELSLKAQEEVNKATRALILFDLESTKKKIDLERTSIQEQISAQNKAANIRIQAFNKIVQSQRALADIYNKVGELAAQRIRTTAQNLNKFLEATGTSIEARLAVLRAQSAAELAESRRSASRQLNAIQGVGDARIFGSISDIRNNARQLIDAISSAGSLAFDSIRNKETGQLNISAARAQQRERELTSSFQSGASALSAEISVRRRLLSQEIQIIQRKIQAEQKLNELRESQQRNFGRLLIDAPEKFAQVIDDFKVSQSFFKDITDVNIDSLRQIQSRLRAGARQGGPDFIRRLISGIESGVKFGLSNIAPGLGNEELQGIVERLAIETPEELNRQLQRQVEFAEENTREQERIRELQDRQNALSNLQAELQRAQTSIQVALAERATKQRADALLAQQENTRKLDEANRLAATQISGLESLGATFSEEEKKLVDEIKKGFSSPTPQGGAPKPGDIGASKELDDFSEAVRKTKETISRADEAFGRFGTNVQKDFQPGGAKRREQLTDQSVGVASVSLQRLFDEFAASLSITGTGGVQVITAELKALRAAQERGVQLSREERGRVRQLERQARDTIRGGRDSQGEQIARRFTRVGEFNQRIEGSFRELLQQTRRGDTEFVREIRALRGQGARGRRNVDVGATRDFFSRRGFGGVAEGINTRGQAAKALDRFITISEKLSNNQEKVSKETSRLIQKVLATEISEGLDRQATKFAEAIDRQSGTLAGAIRPDRDAARRQAGPIQLFTPENVEPLTGQLKVSIAEALESAGEGLSKTLAAGLVQELKDTSLSIDPVELSIALTGNVQQTIVGEEFAQALARNLSDIGLSSQQIQDIQKRLKDITDVLVRTNQMNKPVDR